MHGAVRRATGSGNGSRARGGSRWSIGFGGHAELGAHRAERRQRGILGGEIHGLAPVLALGGAPGQGGGAGRARSRSGRRGHDLALGADHRDHGWAAGVGRIDGLGVVAERVLAVALLRGPGQLPRVGPVRRRGVGHGDGVPAVLGRTAQVGEELGDRTEGQARRVGRGARAGLAFGAAPDLLLLVIQLLALGVAALLDAEEDDAGDGAEQAEDAYGQARLSSRADAPRRLGDGGVCRGVRRGEGGRREVLRVGGHEEAVVVDICGRRGRDGLGQAGGGLRLLGRRVLLGRGVDDQGRGRGGMGGRGRGRGRGCRFWRGEGPPADDVLGVGDGLGHEDDHGRGLLLVLLEDGGQVEGGGGRVGIVGELVPEVAAPGVLMAVVESHAGGAARGSAGRAHQ